MAIVLTPSLMDCYPVIKCVQIEKRRGKMILCEFVIPEPLGNRKYSLGLAFDVFAMKSKLEEQASGRRVWTQDSTF